MVDQADMALVYDATSSGTKHCVTVLRDKGVPFIIYPFEEQGK